MWYSCVVTVAVTIVWKGWHFNIICREHLSDVGDEMCLVLIVLVFLWDPTSSWLLFNELKNKACRNSLIVAQFRDRYIQVKDNEIVDSESLKGDRVRIYRWPLYTGQLNSKYKGWFLESRSVTPLYTGWPLYTGPLYTGSTVQTFVAFRQFSGLFFVESVFWLLLLCFSQWKRARSLFLLWRHPCTDDNGAQIGCQLSMFLMSRAP